MVETPLVRGERRSISVGVMKLAMVDETVKMYPILYPHVALSLGFGSPSNLLHSLTFMIKSARYVTDSRL